jgi:hypothetical protein
MVLEFGVSLGSALAALIIGIILVIVARSIAIEGIINTVLYVIGAIFVIVGIILLALYFVGIIV